MKKFTMYAALALAMVFAISSFAGEPLPKDKIDMADVDGAVILGVPVNNFAKASGDTIQLMGAAGSGAPYVGDFESGFNGWTHFDGSTPDANYWQVSSYQQEHTPGNLALWCGNIALPACGANDTVGGYDNKWNQLVSNWIEVINPAIDASVTVTARLQQDTEPGFDFTILARRISGQLGYAAIATYDDTFTADISENFDYLPTQFFDTGDGVKKVWVVWRVTSDSGWGDVDCLYPSAGACQIDDINILIEQVGEDDINDFADFQDGTMASVRTVGANPPVAGQGWYPDAPDPVGDFTQLWSGLLDVDPCASNSSQQVAFIDDGLIVPGTGGSTGIDWLYGPSGFIVNPNGGLGGPGAKIACVLASPVMAWPTEGYNGCILEWDAYIHESNDSDTPGIFVEWGVRSANADSGLVADQDLKDRGFVYYGAPSVGRTGYAIGDLMEVGRDSVQIEFALVQVGTGPNGTPAPYFDNVSFKVYPINGPGMSTRTIDIANDVFPEGGLTLGSPGLMHCRFDMAKNISQTADERNDAGDSVIVTIVPVRTGAELKGSPTMTYLIKPANDPDPFATYRTVPLTDTVVGWPAVGISGSPDDEVWAWDLPDSSTLFPGDQMHYYFEATDWIGSDPLTEQSSILPDTTNFNNFAPMFYNLSFSIRALPTLVPDGLGSFTQPSILFWSDAGTGGLNEWYGSLAALGLVRGVDYDVYHTQGQSSGVGNGIGRTTALSLTGYNDLLYTSGTNTSYTLSDGLFLYTEPSDPGPDILVLRDWMADGDKDFFITGDNVVRDLRINDYYYGGGSTGMLEDIVGCYYGGQNVGTLIGYNVAPAVLPYTGNSVFDPTIPWIAYGGCFVNNTFDALIERSTAEPLCDWGALDGTPGGTGYQAAVLNINTTSNTRTITLPYGFRTIYTPPAIPGVKVTDAPPAARTEVLRQVLLYFGAAFDPGAGTAADLPTAQFAVSNYPNPFNPSTKISYTIKQAGHLTLKVFNVRGELVRTLIDGNVDSSDFVMWDGTNNDGGSVSSGVYFYEARMGNDVQVNKMALVK